MATPKSKKTRGFTLVELLVVIAIIALLLSILMPALGKVKNQAKVMTCAANSKQIGTVLVVYQNDNDGYVPVMLHKFSVGQVAAKSALLSLPFQRYSGKTTNLPLAVLDPEQPWGMDEITMYSKDYLQKFYVCPFVRGAKQASWYQPAEKNLKIGSLVTTLQNYKSVGLGDSYSTWIWPREAGYPFEAFRSMAQHPYGPDHGKNKYGNLNWHAGGNPQLTGIWVDTRPGYDQIKDSPVRFSRTPRISERTAAYCSQGEADESSHGYIINFGSHSKADKGGTNVIFGDSRVEWVQGSQITAGN